jgi:hypothetical protein
MRRVALSCQWKVIDLPIFVLGVPRAGAKNSPATDYGGTREVPVQKGWKRVWAAITAAKM